MVLLGAHGGLLGSCVRVGPDGWRVLGNMLHGTTDLVWEGGVAGEEGHLGVQVPPA